MNFYSFSLSYLLNTDLFILLHYCLTAIPTNGVNLKIQIKENKT